MKTVVNILAGVLMLVGIVWFLQGINVLPGSFMTGEMQWAIYGALAFIAGGGVLLFANRRRASPPGG